MKEQEKFQHIEKGVNDISRDLEKIKDTSERLGIYFETTLTTITGVLFGITILLLGIFILGGFSLYHFW